MTTQVVSCLILILFLEHQDIYSHRICYGVTLLKFYIKKRWTFNIVPGAPKIYTKKYVVGIY